MHVMIFGCGYSGTAIAEAFAAPGNRVGHAEVRIGDSSVMLGDARGEYKPTLAMLYAYVDDVDVTFQRALAAGATSVQAPTDQFHGDRSGGVKDPYGNLWSLRTARMYRWRN